MKNNNHRVTPEYTIKNTGNWNYKDKSKPPVYSKPICVIKLGEDEFVFTHSDIFELLYGYTQADIDSIKMIKDKDVDTGEIDYFETPLTEKVKVWLKKNKVDVPDDIPKLNHKDWEKNTCDHCGEGHLYCEKCKVYTWHKEDNTSKNTNS